MARKYQWMGIIALFLVMLLLTDSTMAHAMESGIIIGDGVSEDAEAYEINEDEIWAQIDRNELRSFIDVEELKKSIDTQELLSSIDKTAIEESISDINLLDSLDSETILADYNKKKASGELDAMIKNVIEADDFDVDFILNHPVDIPNVTVPIVGENSPFDYILDPQGLVYQTDAARYGGGNVKENANVLFRNTEGEYTFSDHSDKLTITNKSNIPLKVTISARFEDAGDISLVDSISDLHGIDPSLFMALVDDEGIISVLNSSGSSEISVVLKAAPEGTYVYKLNEETGEYEYELADRATFTNSTRKESLIIDQGEDNKAADEIFVPEVSDDKESDNSEENKEEASATGVSDDKVEEVSDLETTENKQTEETSASETTENRQTEEASTSEATENKQTEEVSTSETTENTQVEEISVSTPKNYAENESDDSGNSITRMIVKTNSEDSKAGNREFDSFSFGLYASCNTEANWSNISGLPTVIVTWKTEPILTDWDKVNEELEAYEKVKFEAYKRVRLEELRKSEVQRLVQEELEDLVELRLEELIEAKIDILAKEKYDQLVIEKIAGRGAKEGSSEVIYYSDTERAYDGEDVLIINDTAGQQAVNQTPSAVVLPVPERENAAQSGGTSENVTEEAKTSDSEEVMISSQSSEEASTKDSDIVVFSDTETENLSEIIEETPTE